MTGGSSSSGSPTRSKSEFEVEVLPHARVVVCHGESGTTLGALAAGVPLVVTPLFADQPYNGRRVAAIGAGVCVEPHGTGAFRSAVDPEVLRDAVTTVLAEEPFTRVAHALAAEMRELPPVDEAVGVLERSRR